LFDRIPIATAQDRSRRGVYNAARHCETSAGRNEEHATFACNEHRAPLSA
jgi:hypothetical protein